MPETKIKFELEKENKNSVRYKEIPKDGMPPILGSIYVQKWYAGSSKTNRTNFNYCGLKSKKPEFLNKVILVFLG